jgi:hypothetical protein
MALPIPLILAAGAAVVILGGKKKKSSGGSSPSRTPTKAEIEEVLAMFKAGYSDLEAKAKASGKSLPNFVTSAASAKIPGTSHTYGKVAQHIVDVIGALDSRFKSSDVYSVIVASIYASPLTDRKLVECALAAKTFQAVIACIPG